MAVTMQHFLNSPRVLELAVQMHGAVRVKRLCGLDFALQPFLIPPGDCWLSRGVHYISATTWLQIIEASPKERADIINSLHVIDMSH